MNNVPIRLKCLSDLFISYDNFSSRYKNDWSNDKRIPEVFVKRFLACNKRTFDFLGISACSDELRGVKFSASRYSGVAPLFSPTTGKPFTTIEITGFYNESFANFLNAESAHDLLEFNEDLPLYIQTSIKPPIEYLAANFLSAFLSFKKAKWRKFVSSTVVCNEPSSGTLWSKYALKCYNPDNFLKFPNRKNTLVSEHKEYRELLYAAKVAADVLQSPTTSNSLNISCAEEIAIIDRLVNRIGACFVRSINVSSKDGPEVKYIKGLANAVLTCHFKDSLSWRFDCAKVFERYVQAFFSQAARDTGARAFCNPRYSLLGGSALPWGLSYLEPDMVLSYNHLAIIVDAKYKSHMFNTTDASDKLKESFRADLHQVLAYCNIFPSSRKAAILVYPFHDNVASRRIRMEAAGIDVYLIGLPLEATSTSNTLPELSKILSTIFSFA